MSESRTTDTLAAFAVGIVAGVAAGLLLAPDSGSNTRRRLGQLTEDAVDRARGGADAATDFVQAQAKRVAGAVREGRDAFRSEVRDA